MLLHHNYKKQFINLAIKSLRRGREPSVPLKSTTVMQIKNRNVVLCEFFMKIYT